MVTVQLTALINGSSAETDVEVAAALARVFKTTPPRLRDIEVVDGDSYPIQWLAPIPADVFESAKATGYFADTAVSVNPDGHETLFSIEFDPGS